MGRSTPRFCSRGSSIPCHFTRFTRSQGKHVTGANQRCTRQGAFPPTPVDKAPQQELIKPPEPMTLPGDSAPIASATRPELTEPSKPINPPGDAVPMPVPSPEAPPRRHAEPGPSNVAPPDPENRPDADVTRVDLRSGPNKHAALP